MRSDEGGCIREQAGALARTGLSQSEPGEIRTPHPLLQGAL
jgi:hypothetical protein